MIEDLVALVKMRLTLRVHAFTLQMYHHQQIHDTNEINNSNDRHGDIVRSPLTSGF